MINDKGNEVIEQFFQLLLSRYQIRMETKKVVILSLIVFIYCIKNVIK